jgi:hypothetical protein
VLSEHSLNSNDIRFRAVDDGRQLVSNDEKSFVKWEGRFGTNHANINEFDRTRCRGFDNSKTTSGKTGVDTEDAHRLLVRVEFCLNVSWNGKVRENILYVVTVLERVNEGEDLASRCRVDVDGHVEYVCAAAVDKRPDELIREINRS